MSDFTPRLWIKGEFEQWADTLAAEVRLRFNGWRPKEAEGGEAQSTETPAASTSPAEPKRTGRKPADSTE